MMKGFTAYLLIFAISIIVGASWGHYPIIKETVHGLLDPTAGRLLAFNLYLGFTIVVAVITFFLTLAQRIFVDQKEMKILKEEQKFVQQEIKKYAEHPEKLMELQKRQLQSMGKTFQLMTKSFIVTAIPIILFFRWFQEALTPIWGGWWILYYLIAAIIFQSIFRKLLKLA